MAKYDNTGDVKRRRFPFFLTIFIIGIVLFIVGVVRIDQGTMCRNNGDVYRDLMSVSPSPRRPLFRHVYLLTNYYGFEGNKVVVYERLIKELERVEQDCPDTYEFMLPMDLAASIRKYIEEGGIY